jgi:hypothetical protein
MSEQVCLRCDWTGQADSDTCPECGTVLYRMPEPRPSPPSRPRPAPSPVGPPAPEGHDVFVPVIDRSGPEPNASRLRSWIVGVAVAAVAATAIAALQARPPSAPAAATGPIPGLRGTLVYAARDRDGWVLWSWDLATGRASGGPHLKHPVELVNASEASPGWIGVTSADGRRRIASVVHSVSPDSRVSRIASGDLVTWAAGGRDLASLRFGPRTSGCVRHVEIHSWVVAFGTDEVRFDGPMCGLPLTIARDGDFDYVVEADGPSASIRIVGSGSTQRFMDDHVLVGLSPLGDFLVTPVPKPGGVPGAPPAPGLQLYEPSSPLDGPVAFGSIQQPFQAIDFLSWSWDAMSAYLLGSFDGVRGVYRVTMGLGAALHEPDLVTATDAETVEATVTSGGDVFLLQDDQLSYERDGRIVPLRLPDGAPDPAGPMLWMEGGVPASALT